MKLNFTLALAGALCALPSVAVACSCAPPPAPKIALENSAAVFVGRVTAVKNSQFNNKFQFSVSKQWKGIDGKTASIVSATNSAACGIVFDKDRDYLVYAYKIEGDDQLRTNLCTRTKRVADAADDLAELGAPKTDYPAAMTNYPTDNNGVVQVNAGASTIPSSLLLQALRADDRAQRFRVSWDWPQRGDSHGTALYDRANSTLKVFSQSQKDAKIEVRSVIYSGVTDQILEQAASTLDNGKDAMPAEVTRKDVGSKTVPSTR